MKVVILAGGFGTRISEESQFKPKPMVELGGMPIIWHIMKLYSSYLRRLQTARYKGVFCRLLSAYIRYYI